MEASLYIMHLRRTRYVDRIDRRYLSLASIVLLAFAGLSVVVTSISAVVPRYRRYTHVSFGQDDTAAVLSDFDYIYWV